MKVMQAGTVPSRRAPENYFTGIVWQDPVIDAPAPARLNATRVTFEPGARTAWHTHPLGQTLYVLAGCGLVQSENGSVREIRAGDVVWIPPNEKHWHGASPTTTITHLAMQEAENGSAATWLEHVTDAQYLAPMSA